MKREESINSREKILEAASLIFAEKGYKDATVREICKLADTYQLSVNYYFGSKENLFKEVLHKTYNDTDEFLLHERIKGYPAEKQLEEIIRTRLYSIFKEDKSGIFFRILAKEASNNYELVHETVFSSIFVPYLEFIKSVFSDLSDNTFNEYELSYCSYLLMSHISLFSIHKSAVTLFFNKDKPDEEDLEKFVNQVKTFILAGIQSLKQDKKG